MSTIPPSPPTTPAAGTSTPAADSQTILGRRILTILAIAGFVLAVALLVVGTFGSYLIDTPISRMCLICLVAFSLTTFAWVFYPHAVTASGVKMPFLDWEVAGLAGPLLLFFLTLVVLHLLFPNPAPPPTPATRYYPLHDAGNPPPSQTFLFDGRKTHPQVMVVKDPIRPDAVSGFVASFPDGKPFVLVLANEHHLFKEQSILFEPGAANGTPVNLGMSN